MEILLLEQPDTGYDRPVGRKRISVPQKTFLLAYRLPATFMSAVSCTYILMAKEGFQLSIAIAYPAGIIFAAVCLGTFVYTCVMGKGKNADSPAVEEPYGV